MLSIRLKRVGRKHEPVFRLVLTDTKKSSKSGRSLEVLGSYDSRKENPGEVKADRIKYWISVGAQLSDTVRNLLIGKKVIEGKKVNVLPKKKPIVSEKAAEPVTETPKVSAPEAVKEVEVATEKPAEEAPAEVVAEESAS